MKKAVSKGTKPATKSSAVKTKKTKKKTGPGRGGSRPGAGRAGYVGPMKPFNCDLPEAMLEEIKGFDIKSKTEYFAQLIIEDFKNRGVKKATLSKIEEALVKKKS
jgi:hypothetical protein